MDFHRNQQSGNDIEIDLFYLFFIARKPNNLIYLTIKNPNKQQNIVLSNKRRFYCRFFCFFKNCDYNYFESSSLEKNSQIDKPFKRYKRN